MRMRRSKEIISLYHYACLAPVPRLPLSFLCAAGETDLTSYFMFLPDKNVESWADPVPGGDLALLWQVRSAWVVFPFLLQAADRPTP